MTREEYLDASEQKDAHRVYYAQFVDGRVRGLVANAIGLEPIRGSKDPHFNDIPLKRWDALVSRLPSTVPTEMKRLGDFLTLAGGVCVLKEAAQQLREAP